MPQAAPVPPPRKLAFRYVRHGPPETLADFLARRFRYHDRAQWERLVREGHVTVDEGPAPPQHVLRSRQLIVYVPPPAPEPEVDARFAIVYQDAHLLAVSKSGNIPTSPSGKYWHNCLRHVLQRELGLPQLHAVHRLDRETSGINLFAKSAEAARRLGAAFTAGQVGKTYVAVLRGRLPVREALVSAPLRDAGGEVHIKQAVHPDGRPAQTRFRLWARLPGASLVLAEPLTGRTHQIRAHAAFLGLPVWGDRLYGVAEAEFIRWVAAPDRDLSQRHLLHALELRLSHPFSGEALVLRAGEVELVRLFLEGVG